MPDLAAFLPPSLGENETAQANSSRRDVRRSSAEQRPFVVVRNVLERVAREARVFDGWRWTLAVRGFNNWRRRVATEDVFRSANERIAEKGWELGWRFPIPFLCECSDMHCFGRLELSLAKYRRVRSHPQRYMTVPGHEVTGAFVLEPGENASFAEKLFSGAGPS
jgi:hypothetical protein